MATSYKINNPLVSTSCKDCIFNLSINNVQVDCSFSEDRLKRFEQKGAKLVQKEEDGQKYFLIENRLCRACHNHDWGSRYPKENWKKIVRERVRIPIDVVILTTEKSEVPEILKTFDSVSNQTIKPKSIVLLIENQDIIPDLIVLLKEKNGIPWRIESIDLKEAIRYCKGLYLILLHTGQNIIETFIEGLDHSINILLDKFSISSFNTNYDSRRITVIQNIGLTPSEIIEKGKLTNTSYMVNDNTNHESIPK